MANYKEESIIGNKWSRCNTIVIHNPYDGLKTVNFHEQEIIFLGNNDVIFKQTAITGPESLMTVFEPNTSIQIVNPYTLESTGNTFTHADLYVMLFSAYMDAAKKRDQEIANSELVSANT